MFGCHGHGGQFGRGLAGDHVEVARHTPKRGCKYQGERRARQDAVIT
jgi:hypothetical protein